MLGPRGGNDSGTRGRHELALDVRDRKRQAVGLNDIEGRGNRNRDDAVLAADGAVPVHQARDYDAVDIEVIEKHRHRHDIDDRVNSPYLMEVHLVKGDGVGLGLRVGNHVDHAVRKITGTRRKLTRIDDCIYVSRSAMLVMMVMEMLMAVVGVTMSVIMFVVAMMIVIFSQLMGVDMIVGMLVAAHMVTGMMVLTALTVQIGHVVVMVLVRRIEHDVKIAAVDSGFLYATDAHLISRNGQARQRVTQTRLVGTQVKQGSDGHIAADAVCAIKIERLSHDLPVSAHHNSAHNKIADGTQMYSVRNHFLVRNVSTPSRAGRIPKGLARFSRT